MRTLVLIATLIFTFSVYAQEDIAPQWSLKTETGETVSSTDFAGKPLVIHVWATWCPYCKKLQPGLDRLYKKYQPQGLEMIAISVREDEDATPQAVLDARGYDIKTLIKGESVAEEFNVAGTPTTIFIDKKGNIIAQTTSSDPDDPRLEQVFKYLVSR
ncbi:TlpA disulfide reductase family protein [Aliiglaciecola sp. M165]|uniref:TlpA disulfide reductase family protein n=1 Tax=Aliiglaciecola sp. M165 TaxID=2593649 RepID=UPI00117FC847|nr:TlpA disulfide reductase family protein [Aliiglaciecola sp. M165]TRY31869.1 TlpA family protein disulfide reductase [Aliiglaciecola sp. M165]